jgi:hypothetical protein
LGGEVEVMWRTTGKTGWLHASAYGLHRDDVFRKALASDALATFTHLVFWQQVDPPYPRAELVGSGLFYYGKHLSPEATPVLARGIALHNIAALQRMMLTQPPHPRGLKDYERWMAHVAHLRERSVDTHHGLIQASLALEILTGQRRDGARVRGNYGLRYELVPKTYYEPFLRELEDAC